MKKHKMNFTTILYWVITFIYLGAALYILFNASNINNSNEFAVSIGAISILSVGVSTMSLAYTFSSNGKTDATLLNIEEKLNNSNTQLNEKIDSLLSHYTSIDIIIKDAKQNKELYDLNLIGFDEYESNRINLKNKLKKTKSNL